MQKMKTIKGAVFLLLTSIVTFSQAEEVTLVLNVQGAYPIQAHYQFSEGGHVYGEGELNLTPHNQTTYS